MGATRGLVYGLYDAVFRPSELVRARRLAVEGGVGRHLPQLFELGVVLAVNLGLYAGSLTLAGYGITETSAPPAWFAALLGPMASAGTWTLTVGFVVNSLYLLVATVLTLVVFHVSLVVTGQSRGLLGTSYAVVYSTSAYLAGIFTVVWYLSTTDGLVAARNLVLSVQQRFVYAVIDLLNASLALPSGRPAAADLSALSDHGLWALAVLVVLTGYFLYSLYLGARINHDADRFEGVVVVAAVLLSPAVYVAGSVLAYALDTTPLL